MAAAEVVEGLDPFEHDAAGVVVVLEVVAIDEFDFERGEEGLDAGMSDCRFAR